MLSRVLGDRFRSDAAYSSGSGEPSDPARLDQSWRPPRANVRTAVASDQQLVVIVSSAAFSEVLVPQVGGELGQQIVHVYTRAIPRRDAMNRSENAELNP